MLLEGSGYLNMLAFFDEDRSFVVEKIEEYFLIKRVWTAVCFGFREVFKGVCEGLIEV